MVGEEKYIEEDYFIACMRTPKEILEQSRVIAVVGCSDQTWRDSYRVASYMKVQGYTIYPVNPTIESALGVPSQPDVQSIPEQVDIVNVFRHPRFVMRVVEDAIAAGAKAIWFQLGVVNPDAERRAAEAGLDVVSDRCIAVDYRMYGLQTAKK